MSVTRKDYAYILQCERFLSVMRDSLIDGMLAGDVNTREGLLLINNFYLCKNEFVNLQKNYQGDDKELIAQVNNFYKNILSLMLDTDNARLSNPSTKTILNKLSEYLEDKYFELEDKYNTWITEIDHSWPKSITTDETILKDTNKLLNLNTERMSKIYFHDDDHKIKIPDESKTFSEKSGSKSDSKLKIEIWPKKKKPDKSLFSDKTSRKQPKEQTQKESQKEQDINESSKYKSGPNK